MTAIFPLVRISLFFFFLSPTLFRLPNTWILISYISREHRANVKRDKNLKTNLNWIRVSCTRAIDTKFRIFSRRLLDTDWASRALRSNAALECWTGANTTHYTSPRRSWWEKRCSHANGVYGGKRSKKKQKKNCWVFCVFPSVMILNVFLFLLWLVSMSCKTFKPCVLSPPDVRRVIAPIATKVVT